MNSHPEAAAFHSPAWVRLLADCYGFRSFIAGEPGGEALASAVPVIEVRNWQGKRRWIALPFSDYCPPLAAGGVPLTTLVEPLDALRRASGVSRLEIRWPAFAAAEMPAAPHVLHVLDLDADPANVLSRLNSKHRQYVRKAEKEGLRILPTSSKDMDVFYLLHLKNHAKLGAPVQPRRFFRLVQERLIAAGAGRLFVIGDNRGQPAAAAIVLHQGRNAMIKYSASDPAWLPKRCHYLIFWKAIEWACRNGMRRIDFGRTDSDAAGLIQFKDGWGARQVPLAYTYLGTPPGTAGPVRLAGPIKPLIRHSPLWVGRWIGELLYRRAA